MLHHSIVPCLLHLPYFRALTVIVEFSPSNLNSPVPIGSPFSLRERPSFACHWRIGSAIGYPLAQKPRRQWFAPAADAVKSTECVWMGLPGNTKGSTDLSWHSFIQWAEVFRYFPPGFEIAPATNVEIIVGSLGF